MIKVLPLKTPRKNWMKNNKHNFNAEQSSKECKGNIKGPKVKKNLKSDIGRH